MNVLKQVFDFGADVQVLEVVCVVRSVDLDATGFMTLCLRFKRFGGLCVCASERARVCVRVCVCVWLRDVSALALR